MKKPRQKDINAARIQRAVTRILIPMTRICAVYAHAESLISSGATDDELRAGISAFLA